MAPDFRPVVQVGSPKHYFSSAYGQASRFYSFGIQVSAILNLGVSSVLEVGPGPGVVSKFLVGCGLSVRTVDIDARLGPDVVADGCLLPFADSSFGATICCEVLEHLPFDSVGACLAEMRRVSSAGAVISVPNQQQIHSVDATLPLGRVRLSWPVLWRRPTVHEFDGQHYWELGSKGYPVQRFRDTIVRSGWSLGDELRDSVNPSHHFFFLR